MRIPFSLLPLMAVAWLALVAPQPALAQAPTPARKLGVKPVAITARLTEPKAITATEDEAGCVDSPLLARVAGCKILQCSKKTEDTVDIAVEAESDGSAHEVEVEGASETIYYLCASKDPAMEIVPSLEANLRRDAFHVAFSGKDGDDSVVSANKLGQWIQVSTYVYDGKPAYVQTALKAAPEEFVSAEDFEDQFPVALRVALSGVKFAAGKFSIPAASEKMLLEVTGILVKKLEWKLRIDAYATDGGIDAAANMALSKARATAILDWFVAHGIVRERLDSVGFGDTVPIPEGKQRLEILKM